MTGSWFSNRGSRSELQELGVRVQENRISWENDVDGVHVSIRRDFLEEQIGLALRTAQLGRTECLPGRKGSKGEVILTSDSNRFRCNLLSNELARALESLKSLWKKVTASTSVSK